MSTGKHIDRICIAAIAITLVVTMLFMCGGSLGLTAVAQAMQYESTLFDTSYVHEIDIVMDDWDSFIESCENEEYASCTVVIDGEKHSNIAIRAKGNTSLSNVSSLGSQRYSFKLEFDHYEDAKTLDGLDKLCLNNLIQDNTMMKDYLVYQMMADFGVDTPLCSFAYLTVNGVDWGLYLAVEGVEDSFLSRNYGSDTGELYKPDSLSFGGGRGNGKDFNMEDFDFGEMADLNTDDAAQTTPAQTDSAVDSSADASTGNTDAFPGGMGGMTPPTGFGDNADGGSTLPEGFDESSIGGMTPPTGFGDNADGGSTLPEGFDESSFGGMTPPTGFGEDGDFSMPDNAGGFGGMGSDDVKLQYIDDDPDSYSNIFDNAKTDVSSADEQRLIQALKSLSSYTDLEDAVDMEQVLRYFVVHNFVVNGDSYTGSMIHNYYLHESDGQLSMIPWDYNLAFGTFQGGDASSSVNASIDSPVSGGNADDRPMVGWIFSDDTYTEAYHALFAEFIEKWFTNGELEQRIAETADMIRSYVEKDPTKFCTTEEFEAGVTALTEFVTLRAEAVSRQLNGDTTAVNTDGLNVSDMGTMSSGQGNMEQGGMNQPRKQGDASDPQTDPADTPETAPAETTQTAPAEASTAETEEDAIPVASAMGFQMGGNMQKPGGGFTPPSIATDASGNVQTPPEMPADGMGDAQTPPDMPADSTGDAQTPPEMPNEDAGTAPEETTAGDAGTAPEETAAGEPETTPAETAAGDTPSTDTANGGEAANGSQTQPRGNMDFSQMPSDMTNLQSSTNGTNAWIWVGISVLILAAGLFVAIRKKI